MLPNSVTTRTLVLEVPNRIHFLKGFHTTLFSAHRRMSDKAGVLCLDALVCTTQHSVECLVHAIYLVNIKE